MLEGGPQRRRDAENVVDNHLLLRRTTAVAVTARLSRPNGSSTFQPSAIRRSYLRRGRVARSQKSRKIIAPTLSRNHMNPGSSGPCQPPRKTVAAMGLTVTMVQALPRKEST